MNYVKKFWVIFCHNLLYHQPVLYLTFSAFADMAICNIDASFIDCNLKYKDLIPVIEECMANFSRRIKGEIEQPVRTVVRAENSDGWVEEWCLFKTRTICETFHIVKRRRILHCPLVDFDVLTL